MKTAISLDDETFRAAEAMARRLGVSRSELYATALRKYLREQDEQALSEAFDRVYGALGGQDPETAEGVREAAQRTSARSEW